MTKQKNSNKINNQRKEHNIKKPKIYIPIKTFPNKCYTKKGKSILASIKMNDTFTSEKFDLGQFFSRLEKVAGSLNISKLQVVPSEIFEFISINDFKDMGNKILKKVKIALLNKVTVIEKKNAKAILDIMLK